MPRPTVRNDAPNRENEGALRVKLVTKPAEGGRAPLGDVGNKQGLALVVSKKTNVALKPAQDVKKPIVLHKTKIENNKPKKVLERSEVCTNLTKSSINETTNFEKFDLSSDPQLVSIYINDIYMCLREEEERFPINPNYLNNHKTSPRSRQILVNWLVEAHHSFKMVLETLHITIAIIDRFLQINKSVSKDTLQLVGATAFFIAAKFEEIYPVELPTIKYLCDNTFSKSEILQMEIEIMKSLKFEFNRPVSIHFLRRYNQVCEATAEYHSLGKYLLELCLLNYDMCHIRPSLQAAAACCLSNAILGGFLSPSQGWTEVLVHFSKYKYEDIKGVVIKMACMLGNAPACKEQAVREKYSSSKFHRISLHLKLKGPLVRKLIAQSPVENLTKF